MKDMIACCGLDCEKCDAYLATIHHDDALRAKTAKLWSELNQVPITPEMIHCTGCRADGAKTYFCSDLCKIRKCVQGKGFETCGECAEMESCKTVAEIHQHSEDAVKNLKNR